MVKRDSRRPGKRASAVRTPIIDLHGHFPMQLPLPARPCDDEEQTNRNHANASEEGHADGLTIREHARDRRISRRLSNYFDDQFCRYHVAEPLLKSSSLSESHPAFYQRKESIHD